MSRSKDQWIAATGGFPLSSLLRHVRVLPAPREIPPLWDDPIFWDTDTELIRLRGTWPKPIVACTANLTGRKLKAYRPKQFPQLRQSLEAASLVVTYNGDGFDIPVLAAELGIAPRKLRITSFDLMRAIKKTCGTKYNLCALAAANLGETKRNSGAVSRRSVRETTADCHSDVSQLRRLTTLFLAGKLKVPLLAGLFTNAARKAAPFSGQCPHCFDFMSINRLDHDEDEDDRLFSGGLLAEVIGNPAECAKLARCESMFRCFSCGMYF